MAEMTLDAAVRGRHSVRGFLPDPVPKTLMHKVFDLAQWSPSGTNVQPWHICVASGSVRDALRDEFLRRVKSGVAATPDHHDKGRLSEPFKSSQMGQILHRTTSSHRCEFLLVGGRRGALCGRQRFSYPASHQQVLAYRFRCQM